MKYAVGMYGGSFDPLHIGHIHDIIRAAAVCEELYVMISWCEGRESTSKELRYRWIHNCVKHLPNVKIRFVEDQARSKEEYNTDLYWEKGAEDIKALIGKKMDKAAEQAKQVEGAQVEQVTDNNGLQAVKVTFDSGILFSTSSSNLSSSAKSSLSKFANDVLNQNRDMDVTIYGYTDNQGWKNSTAEQSYQKNLNLSQERAQSVASYLLACGVSTNQIKSVQGMGEANPIADNSTAAGRQENRRGEIYLYASQQMIQQAEAGTL